MFLGIVVFSELASDLVRTRKINKEQQQNKATSLTAFNRTNQAPRKEGVFLFPCQLLLAIAFSKAHLGAGYRCVS
jgi:hypothetical protein